MMDIHQSIESIEREEGGWRELRRAQRAHSSVRVGSIKGRPSDGWMRKWEGERQGIKCVHSIIDARL